MRSEQEILESINNLRSQLGEDQFTPQSDDSIESIQARVNALDRQLASTPESFSEYVERRKVEDSRSLGDKTAAFTESFMTGAGALASEGSKAISELFSGDVGASEVGGVFQVGINDFGRFAETLGGAAMDNFYSDETEMQREYQRYKDNFLYNQEVRPAMLETYDEEGRDFVSFGANFVDPTLLVPAAGLIAKGGSLGAKAVATGAKAGAFAARSPRLVQLSKAMAKTSRGAEKVAKGLDKASEVASIPAKLAASGTRKAIKGSAFVGSKIAGGVGRTGEAVSKVAALPRNLATKLIPKIDPKTAGAVAATAQIGAATQGMVPGLGILTSAEILGFLANKTGRGVERTLSALSSTGGQKRFLQRLATTADSPRLRKLALMAHAGGATKLTDLAFNSLVNGASVGALNGALAYISGEGAEGVGAAVGSGTLMGGSLPFGQPGMKGGKSQAARDQSSINFLNAKLQDDQIKEFRKLSPEARLAFATVEEAGIPRPQLAFLDKQTYLDLLRKDDPNLRSAPNAHYGIADNTIYINQDGNAGRSSKEAMDILTHELGHHFIKQAIKDDPFFAEKILSEYKAKPGEESFDFAFTTDSAGAPIDSIKLNKKAVDIADLYGGIQDGIGIGKNAEKLAQEIGAEQFAMMMVDNPNIFKTIEPSLRQKLLDGSRKVLTMFGAVDPYTGNPLDVSILGPEGVKSKNPLVQRSKSIRNLYKNYVKQREYALADKIDLAENPMKIKLQRGEKPQQAVQRLFNTKGISLKEAKAFRINNLKVKEKLVEIKKRLLENPTGGMRAFVNKSGNAIAIIGKTLTPEVRSVFTGNDPFGNINTLINVAIDGIREKAQFTFLYRAGKPSKYSDNELRPRVVSPIQLRVTGLSDNSKSAASLKLDCFDEAYLRNNAEVLVQEGFAKDPKTLIEEGRRVAKESLNDPEGRINPKGEKENELVTALFGQPESAGFIKNKKLRALLDPEQGGRLKHSIRSYDFDALAGLVPTGKDGISFDWDNVKHNHMPLDEKLFMPTEIQEGSPGSYFRPKSSRDTSTQVRTFKSPVQLKDGSRLSGVADNPEQSPFYGFDKNGKEFSQGREYINPQDITKSRDSDRTANQIRNELESGQKLFMPASEAGAGKGKQAEAAKLWNEKGTDSPYFKKWFDKSKVVGENGEPLVVYHGTSDYGFNIFDFLKLGERTGAKSAEEGIFFTSSKAVADGYAHLGEGDTFAPMVEQIKKLESQLNDLQKTPLKEITPQLQETYAKLESQKNEIGRELHQARMQRGSIIDSGGLPPKAPGAGVYSTYLSFQNPKIVDLKGKTARALDQAQTFTDIIKEAKANGHDSVIFKNAKDNATRDTVNIESDIFVAFSPEQIKSASGNRGTFDAGERNILFMPAIKLYGPVENIGGIRLKNSTIGQVAVLGRGKETKEYYKNVVIKGKKYTPNLPDGIAAKAISKNNDWEAKQLLDFVDKDWHKSDNAKLSRDAWQKIEKKKRAEEADIDASEKKELKEVEQFLSKSGKDLSHIKNVQEYDTYIYGSKTDGLVYRGEGKSKEPWIVDEGVEVASSESSNISNSEYPILKVKLKNGGSFFQQIRISDHDQVSARAPRDYIYDYRKKSLGEALPDIVEDMQAKAWELWDDQRMDFKETSKQFMPSDSKAQTRQPANRIQQQAPSMPGNRFMAPAAKTNLTERSKRNTKTDMDNYFKDPISGQSGTKSQVLEAQELYMDEKILSTDEGLSYGWDDVVDMYIDPETRDKLSTKEVYSRIFEDAETIQPVSRIDHLINQSEDFKNLNTAESDNLFLESDFVFIENGESVRILVDGKNLIRLTDDPKLFNNTKKTDIEGLYLVSESKSKISDLTSNLTEKSILNAMKSRNSRTWQRLTQGEIGVEEALRIEKIVTDRHQNSNYDELLKAGYSKEDARFLKE